MRAIFGIDRSMPGRSRSTAAPAAIRGPGDALAAGIALVPEDRGRAGLVREHSVGHNILMAPGGGSPGPASSTTGGRRARPSEFVERAQDPDDRPRPGGQGPLGRQPAEGRRRQEPVCRAIRASPRRPDGRRRRRLQARDPPACARARRARATASCWSRRSSRSSAAWRIACSSCGDGAVARVLDRAAGDDLSVRGAVPGRPAAARGVGRPWVSPR